MSGEMNQLTERDQIILSTMNLLGMDTVQTQRVVEFVGDDVLNHQLFIRYFNVSQEASTELKVSDAIDKATAAKVIF